MKAPAGNVRQMLQEGKKMAKRGHSRTVCSNGVDVGNPATGKCEYFSPFLNFGRHAWFPEVLSHQKEDFRGIRSLKKAKATGLGRNEGVDVELKVWISEALPRRAELQEKTSRDANRLGGS